MVDPIRGKIGGMFTDRHRQRECRNCGQDFNQRELSPEFVSFIKRQPDSTQRAWLAVVKENALHRSLQNFFSPTWIIRSLRNSHQHQSQLSR